MLLTSSSSLRLECFASYHAKCKPAPRQTRGGLGARALSGLIEFHRCAHQAPEAECLEEFAWCCFVQFLLSRTRDFAAFPRSLVSLLPDVGHFSKSSIPLGGYRRGHAKTVANLRRVRMRELDIRASTVRYGSRHSCSKPSFFCTARANAEPMMRRRCFMRFSGYPSL